MYQNKWRTRKESWETCLTSGSPILSSNILYIGRGLKRLIPYLPFSWCSPVLNVAQLSSSTHGPASLLISIKLYLGMGMDQEKKFSLWTTNYYEFLVATQIGEWTECPPPGVLEKPNLQGISNWLLSPCTFDKHRFRRFRIMYKLGTSAFQGTSPKCFCTRPQIVALKLCKHLHRADTVCLERYLFMKLSQSSTTAGKFVESFVSWLAMNSTLRTMNMSNFVINFSSWASLCKPLIVFLTIPYLSRYGGIYDTPSTFYKV